MKADTSGGFARTYGVELLLASPPQISRSDLLLALRRRCGQAEVLGGDKKSESLSFAFGDYPVTYAEGEMPAQALVIASDKPTEAQILGPSLDQSWDWPEARAVVARHRSTLLITDLMASGLDYKKRLHLFLRVVQAVVETVPCLAIHWRPSGRLVDPAAYLASLADLNNVNVLFPAVNVRLFSVSDRAPDETLMDTLGLAALGLPDLQCHFLGLDPNDVAGMLFNSALYLYDNGDVINNGETIQGLAPSQRWVCRHEDALAPPQRVVLDVNPGPPYAAGDR